MSEEQNNNLTDESFESMDFEEYLDQAQITIISRKLTNLRTKKKESGGYNPAIPEKNKPISTRYNYYQDHIETMMTEGNEEKDNICIPVLTPKNKTHFLQECLSSLSSTNTESNVGSCISQLVTTSNVNSIVEFDADL
mmetsp:Transcript_6309/g.5423  ORF Transcript_6309/g.5423 Transcript_6309/m.5423 type:complete len:138 (+) Transcript_6309:35-448(+)